MVSLSLNSVHPEVKRAAASSAGALMGRLTLGGNIGVGVGAGLGLLTYDSFNRSPQKSVQKQPAPHASLTKPVNKKALLFAGPIGPGPLTPPDLALGAPATTAPQPQSSGLSRDDVMEATVVAAGTLSGEIIGGIVGQALIPIPVVGEQIGQWTGALIGGIAGLGWHKLFN